MNRQRGTRPDSWVATSVLLLFGGAARAELPRGYFTNPEPVPGVNSPFHWDFAPSASHDGLMLFFAISSGPVSLVSTINSSRPFFVLLFAIIFSLVVPTYGRWRGGRNTLILRVVATLMIVGGISLIYLK